jgi:hypothetical protein
MIREMDQGIARQADAVMPAVTVKPPEQLRMDEAPVSQQHHL